MNEQYNLKNELMMLYIECKVISHPRLHSEFWIVYYIDILLRLCFNHAATASLQSVLTGKRQTYVLLQHVFHVRAILRNRLVYECCCENVC